MLEGVDREEAPRYLVENVERSFGLADVSQRSDHVVARLGIAIVIDDDVCIARGGLAISFQHADQTLVVGVKLLVGIVAYGVAQQAEGFLMLTAHGHGERTEI